MSGASHIPPAEERALEALANTVETLLIEAALGAVDSGQIRKADMSHLIAAIGAGSNGALMLLCEGGDWRQRPWPEMKARAEQLAEGFADGVRQFVAGNHPDTPEAYRKALDARVARRARVLKRRWRSAAES